MTNEEKAITKNSTRRNFLAGGIVAVLAVFTGVHVNFRRKRGKRQKGVIEIPNRFDISEVVQNTPEQLGIPSVCGPIEIFTITNIVKDSFGVQQFFGISYTFFGEENPSKRSHIELAALDKSGKDIGNYSELVEDPRVRRKRDEGWQEGDPRANLWGVITLQVDGEDVIQEIDSFRITAISFEI